MGRRTTHCLCLCRGSNEHQQWDVGRFWSGSNAVEGYSRLFGACARCLRAKSGWAACRFGGPGSSQVLKRDASKPLMAGLPAKA